MKRKTVIKTALILGSTCLALIHLTSFLDGSNENPSSQLLDGLIGGSRSTSVSQQGPLVLSPRGHADEAPGDLIAEALDQAPAPLSGARRNATDEAERKRLEQARLRAIGRKLAKDRKRR